MQIIEQLQQLHWSEAGAVGFGIIYVILAARESVWCWVWGILSCLLWAWAAFSLYDLYVDAMLQWFYVGVSFVGIWQWLRGGAQAKVLKISRMRMQDHLLIISVGLVLTAIIGYFFDQYTQAAATYLDSFTTVFSIFATFMVIRKHLENWLYWIVIDGVYIFLYGKRGSVLFTALFVVYLIIAVVGWFEWKRKYEGQGDVVLPPDPRIGGT